MDLAFEQLCTLACQFEAQRQQMLVRSIRPMSKHAGLTPVTSATTELLAAFGAGDPMLPDCGTSGPGRGCSCGLIPTRSGGPRTTGR